MAFTTLLNRYTGQEDIVVCSPVLGRNQSEIEGLIGYFNNILPLRTDLSGNPSFQDLLRRGSQVTTAAYEHQDLPFQELADLVFMRLAVTSLPTRYRIHKTSCAIADFCNARVFHVAFSQ